VEQFFSSWCFFLILAVILLGLLALVVVMGIVALIGLFRRRD
jgi:hypothetical protein